MRDDSQRTARVEKRMGPPEGEPIRRWGNFCLSQGRAPGCAWLLEGVSSSA
jgi:hypothetical protein